MTEKETRSDKAARLRKQAEAIARKNVAGLPENKDAMSPEETRQALHELRVHQISCSFQEGLFTQ